MNLTKKFKNILNLFPSPTFLRSAHCKPQSLLIRNENNIYYISSNKTSMSNIITVPQKYDSRVQFCTVYQVVFHGNLLAPPPPSFLCSIARQKLMYIVNTDRYN